MAKIARLTDKVVKTVDFTADSHTDDSGDKLCDTYYTFLSIYMRIIEVIGRAFKEIDLPSGWVDLYKLHSREDANLWAKLWQKACSVAPPELLQWLMITRSVGAIIVDSPVEGQKYTIKLDSNNRECVCSQGSYKELMRIALKHRKMLIELLNEI